MEPGKTRILLADDHALVRRGLRLILDGEPDLLVVAEAATVRRPLSSPRVPTSTWPSWTLPVSCPFYPSSSLTDAQWAVLAPLLPPPGNTQGDWPEKYPRRVILDVIFYLALGGVAWRQLPSDFPPAMTVYDIFSRWANGVWQRIHDALRDLVRVRAGRQPLPTAAVIDSQTVRGADTVPTATAGYDADKKTKGRDRDYETLPSHHENMATSPWS